VFSPASNIRRSCDRSVDHRSRHAQKHAPGKARAKSHEHGVLRAVIPGRCEASNYDVQLHIRESRDSGFALRAWTGEVAGNTPWTWGLGAPAEQS
jgi:hypothetical protein